MALTNPANRPLLRAAALLWPASAILPEWVLSHRSPWMSSSSCMDQGDMQHMQHVGVCRIHTAARVYQQAQRVATPMSVTSQLSRETGMISRQLLGSEMHKCNGQGRYAGTVKVFEQYMKHAQEAAKKNGGKTPLEWQLSEEELLMYLDAITKSRKDRTAQAVSAAIDTAKSMGVRVGSRSQCVWIKALCHEGKVTQAYDQLKRLPASVEVDFGTILHMVVGLIAANHGMMALGCGMFLLEQRTRLFKSAIPEQRQLVLHHLLQTASNFKRFRAAITILLKAEELGEEVLVVDLLDLIGSAAEEDNKEYCEIFLRMLEKRRQANKAGSAPLQIPEGALLLVLNSAARRGDTTLAVDVFNLLCENLSEPPWRQGAAATPDTWQPAPPSPFSFHAIIHSFIHAAQCKPAGDERNELLNSAFNYMYQLEAAYHAQPNALSPRHGLAFFVEALQYKPGVAGGPGGASGADQEGTKGESKEESESESQGSRRRRRRLEMTPDQVLEVLKTRRASGQMVTTGMLNVVLSARSQLAATELEMMGAAELFDSFPTEFGVGHNIDSVNCLVKNAISTPAAVDALLRFIEDNGLQATADTYAEMMESHLRQSNIDGFLQAMRRSIKAGFEPSSTILKRGLNHARRLNHRDGIRRLTVELQTLGIIPLTHAGVREMGQDRQRRRGNRTGHATTDQKASSAAAAAAAADATAVASTTS